MSSGIKSRRVDSIWPNLTKIGPEILQREPQPHSARRRRVAPERERARHRTNGAKPLVAGQEFVEAVLQDDENDDAKTQEAHAPDCKGSSPRVLARRSCVFAAGRRCVSWHGAARLAWRSPDMSPFLTRLLASAAVLAVAACSTPLRPDLARLYLVGTGPGDTTPVIVIPGLFGSKLRSRTTGVEVWPGTWSDVLWGDYRGLAVDFDPVTLAVRGDDIEAYDLADSVLGHDIYRPIIDTLQRFGGYVRGAPGTRAEPGERRFYVFPYDWRQDNVVHARELEALIDTIRRDYGNPDLKVDIVAHSMGGLIARYYLRYGTVDVLESGSDELVTLYGTTRVRKLILLGTPNMGSAGSLHAFIGGESIGFGRIPTEVLATIPSGYQLFPHPLVTWLIDAQGRGLYEDLFEQRHVATVRLVCLFARGGDAPQGSAGRGQRRVPRGVAPLLRLPPRARPPVHVDAVDAGARNADPLCAVRRRLHADAGAPRPRG